MFKENFFQHFSLSKDIKSNRVGRTGRLSTVNIKNIKPKHLLSYLLLKNLKSITQSNPLHSTSILTTIMR